MTAYTNVPNEYSGTEQGIYLGGLATMAEQVDATPQNPVGCVTRLNGNLYRYVYLNAGTTVAGAPAYWLTTTATTGNIPELGLFKVTATNGATGADNNFAGIFLASGTTTGRYIWIQVAGFASIICTSGAVYGSRIVASASDTFTRVLDTVSEPNLSVGMTTTSGATNAFSAIIFGQFGW